jgi:opacity protein-like surface antigen
MVNVYTRIITMLTLMLFSATSVFAADMSGRLGIGLRAGASIVTQNIDSSDPSTEAETGPIISVTGSYGVNQSLVAGLNVEWETHGLEEGGEDIGDYSTVSILPFVELHFPASDQLSPYLLLGIGYNVNSADVGGVAEDFCDALGVSCDYDPDNTFALKVGGGVDFLVNDNLAINAEVGWKLNSGDVDLEAGGLTIGSADSKASALSILVGFRWLM